MSRVRVIGLVALGVLAVLLYLIAPEEGRFSQTPTLVLVGVIALLWHLAWTDAVESPAEAPTSAASADDVEGAPVGPSSSPVPAETAAAHVAAVVPTEDDEEDLSLLPDPPADWPPPGVEVPMVFRAEAVEVEVVDLTDRPAARLGLFDADWFDLTGGDADRIDLTGGDADRIDLTGGDADRIDLTPGAVAPSAPTPAPAFAPAPAAGSGSEPLAAGTTAADVSEPGRSGDAEPDPWLAFAAAMFRDD